MMTPEQVIQKIRRHEYSLDIEASDEVRSGIKRLQRKLDNALRLLSEGLYSKKTHFVLELVQNADDNEYPSGVTPSLTFCLASDRLVLVNNETGFTAEHVASLCSIGESSKAHKKGYIGEKGIGFKSVFTVSDAPEIHSNGYHFYFDRTNEADLLGYVVPHWREPLEPLVENATTIILPAKQGQVFSQATLEDLRPQLLLFLGKLRQLVMQHQGAISTLTRTDAEGLSCLVSTTERPDGETHRTESKFLRVEVPISMSGAEDELRPEVDTSAMVLAFAVAPDGSALPLAESQVFAFLPVRPFGFRFAIHADFLLSSSRQDLHTDRKWNERLRDRIASAFGVAVEEFKKRDALAFSYLDYLSDPTEIIDPFFRAAAEQIIEVLSSSRSLPSAGGIWDFPKNLRTGSLRFKELFPSASVRELWGLDYVDDRVTASTELLHKLGVEPFTYKDVVSVFERHSDWLLRQPKDWKARFYAYLADTAKDVIKAGLALAKCIPTDDGKLVAPSEVSVFRPLSRRKRYGFEHELVIIDRELFDMASAMSEKVGDLLTVLKVQQDEPYALVTSHILPRHGGEAWKTSKDGALVGHVRYIKDKLDHYLEGAAAAGKTRDAALQRLRDGIWLGTKQRQEGKWLFDRPTNLYLAKEYRPEFSIESLLETAIAASSIVTADYVSVTARESEEELESWRQFLVLLGVHDSPRLLKLTNGDVRCADEAAALLASPKSGVRRAALEAIDRSWVTFSTVLQFAEKQGRAFVLRETQFARSLKAMTAPCGRRASVPIAQTYYPTPELVNLLGQSATYLDAKITNTGLLDACGVGHTVDAQVCLKRLRQLRTDGGDTAPMLHGLYRCLEGLWHHDGALIRSTFHHEPLIRVKGPHAVWAVPDDVSWRSNGPFLDSIYPPLQGQYRDYSNFFVKKIGVDAELSTEKMVEALPKLKDIESPDERKRQALVIYRRASRELTSSADGSDATDAEWLSTFEAEAVFVNQRGELVARSDSLFANDNPEIGTLFLDDAEISFLDAPLEELPRVRALLDAVDVPSVSAEVEIEVIDGGEGRRRVDLTAALHSVIVPMARAFYSKSPAVLERSIEQGKFAELRELEVWDVPRLELQVRLAGACRKTDADVALQGRRLIVRRDAPTVTYLLARELCKLADAPEELSDTVCLLLMAKDVEMVEHLLRARHVSRLPDDIERALWGLPEAGGAPPDVETAGEETDSDEQTSGAGDAVARPLDAESGPTDGAVPVVQPSPHSTGRDLSSAAGGETGVRNRADPVAVGNGASDNAGSTVSTGAVAESPALHRRETTVGEDRDHAPGRVDGAGVERSQAIELTGLPLRKPEQGSVVGGDRLIDRSSQPRGDRAQGPRNSRTKSGRLMSYASSPDEYERERKEEDPQLTAARNATCQAAVEYFVATQSGNWKSLEVMPHNNPGFDIKAVTHEDDIEFIEVKGQGAAWTEQGVALTPFELATAQRCGDKYWLCVVEYAQDDKRRVMYLLKNPYGMTQQFRFDSGWKSAATVTSAAPRKPLAGLLVDIPGEGEGRIISVQRRGQFCRMHVQLDGGRQINKPFNPATMKLRRD